MQTINFTDQVSKDAAVAEQVAENALEVIAAQAVFDKKVARGVARLTALQNATVGAVVPPSTLAVLVAGLTAQSGFAVEDEASVIAANVNDPSLASTLNSQLSAKAAAQLGAVVNALNSGSSIANRLV